MERAAEGATSAIAARFHSVEEIADAVLNEGYLLYPYRASALKNRWRWQFGVVAPRGYSEGQGTEPWHLETVCLVEPTPRTRIAVKVRFLQLQNRMVEQAVDPARGIWKAVDRALHGGREYLPWEEGVAREVTLEEMPLANSYGEVPIVVPGGQDVEPLPDAGGAAATRLVRERKPIAGIVRLMTAACGEWVRVTIQIENAGLWPRREDADRAEALRRSLIGCHALIGLEDGAFVSLIDPPLEAADAARSCENRGLWPVLALPEGSRDVMLAAPIILYDYPQVAAESPGDFFDVTEIDELLALRVLTMTEREKAEAAATDDRAHGIVDRVHGAAMETIAGLHGAIRRWEAAPPSPGRAPRTEENPAPAWEDLLNPPGGSSPEEASITVDGTMIARGSRVRLAPRRRGDSMDFFLAGKAATVRAVHQDLEDRSYVAVTVDDDPAADLHLANGRLFYFAADEIEPLGAQAKTEEASHEAE
jgi:hypothetical protein